MSSKSEAEKRAASLDEVDNNISNPRYSPVIIQRRMNAAMPVTTDKSPPVYIEMGVKNPVFTTADEESVAKVPPKLTSLRSGGTRNGEQAIGTSDGAEPAYLMPLESPLAKDKTVFNVNDPHYEDLGHILAKIDNTPSRNSTVSLPKKKVNLIYEPSTINKKRTKLDKRESVLMLSDKDVPCCILCALVIIGVLALFAAVLSVLIFGGVVKIKNCECDGTAFNTASSSGRLGPAPINAPDNSSLYLEERLALLEANITSLKVNITSLKERMISQETELGQLRNLTKGYRGQMKTLEDRLAEEERKSKNLNASVVALSNMQQAIQATTSTVNITLSSSIDSLQKQTSSQETKITSVDTHIKGNFTSLASMITAEATIRELNDSRLRSELASNAQQQADTMSSLSARLTALNETTRQGLSSVKTSVQSLTENLTRSVVNLDLTDQNLLYQLTSLRMNLSNQISNISLTPGPQGPAGTNGVGNLTACSVQTTSGFASSSQTVTRVHYTVPSDQVLTGAYCYADKKGVYTEYDKSNIQCKCSSVSPISGGFNCHIVVWLCPRTS